MGTRLMDTRTTKRFNGKRHVTKYVAKIGDVEAVGDTATEAKNECNKLVEQSLTGSYEPGFVRYGDLLGVFYRTLEGWTYKITKETQGSLLGSSMPDRSESRESIERRMRLHMAENYIGGNAGYEVLKHPDDIEEYRIDQKFQELYRQAKVQGMDDNDAHRFACENR